MTRYEEFDRDVTGATLRRAIAVKTKKPRTVSPPVVLLGQIRLAPIRNKVLSAADFRKEQMYEANKRRTENEYAREMEAHARRMSRG